MDNIFCIDCGFELPSTAKFCLKCGEKIPEIVINDSKITKDLTPAEEKIVQSEDVSTHQDNEKKITVKPEVIKTKPKTIESKAMAIGTALLEWIIIFVVAGVISLVGVVLFGAAGGSVMGFVGWLIARATMRSILKSILPLRYQDETDEEEEKEVEVEEEEVEEEEVSTEVDKGRNSEFFTISSLEAFGFVIGTIIVLAILGLIITISE